MQQAAASNGLTVAERSKATDRPYPPDTARVLESAEPVRVNARPFGEPNRNSFPFSAPPCRIFQSTASVTRAGRPKSQDWVLAFEPNRRRWIEPLMGWTATRDPFAQIRLTFPTLAAAVAYAEREGLTYQVIEPPARKMMKRRS